MEKVYKHVLPCGILTTSVGDVYWLLHPYPIVADDWQCYNQQRFVVVPRRGIDIDNATHETKYNYARHIVCTAPVIEYRYMTDPILVLQVEEEYNLVPDEDEEEPEDLLVATEMFLESIGAKPLDKSYETGND